MEAIYLQIINYGFLFILLFVITMNSKIRALYFKNTTVFICTIVTILYAAGYFFNIIQNVVTVFFTLTTMHVLFSKKVIISGMTYLNKIVLLMFTCVLFLVFVNQLVSSVFVLSLTISVTLLMLFLLYSSYKIDKTSAIDEIEVTLENNFIENRCECDDFLENTLATIHKQFVDTKCYLNSDYSLSQLEKDLKIDRKEISKAINKVAGHNFYHFIALYRVNYAKEILLKDSRFTLETLSSECGFYSKSTFNKYFKHFEGQTPSSFKLSHS